MDINYCNSVRNLKNGKISEYRLNQLTPQIKAIVFWMNWTGVYGLFGSQELLKFLVRLSIVSRKLYNFKEYELTSENLFQFSYTDNCEIRLSFEDLIDQLGLHTFTQKPEQMVMPFDEWSTNVMENLNFAIDNAKRNLSIVPLHDNDLDSFTYLFEKDFIVEQKYYRQEYILNIIGEYGKKIDSFRKKNTFIIETT
jgi:hypothetical protein